MLGYSVTQRIKTIQQPRGGYLPPRLFEQFTLGDGEGTLHPAENIHPGLVGLAVDYLTRYMSGSTASESFEISLRGAHGVNETRKAVSLLRGVVGLDTASIVNAVKLTGFDVVYRAGAERYRPVNSINPDMHTVQNIRAMVNRALSFLEKYGPKTADGFTFEGGYTPTVAAGDGDFLTADTLWDFKVSKGLLTPAITLQLFMYWRMGLRSIHPEFQDIEYLGVYNPRKDRVYRCAVDCISDETLTAVDTEVIGYTH